MMALLKSSTPKINMAKLETVCILKENSPNRSDVLTKADIREEYEPIGDSTWGSTQQGEGCTGSSESVGDVSTEFVGDARTGGNNEPNNQVTAFKTTLVNELLKSNHELRLRLAETENRIAQLRLQISSQCECRSVGRLDRSSGSSRDPDQLNRKFWRKELSTAPTDESHCSVRTLEDGFNPYVKVLRWQDALSTRESRTVLDSESSSSSVCARNHPARVVSPKNTSTRFAPNLSLDSSNGGLLGGYSRSPIASIQKNPGATYAPKSVETNLNRSGFSMHQKLCNTDRQLNNMSMEGDSNEQKDCTGRQVFGSQTQPEWIVFNTERRPSESSFLTAQTSVENHRGPTEIERENSFISDGGPGPWVHREPSNSAYWGIQKDASSEGLVGRLMRRTGGVVKP